MSYTPTEWKTGDVITAEKLNNMESEIVDARVMVVTISGRPGSFTADKTVTEIMTFLDKGGYVIAKSPVSGSTTYALLNNTISLDEETATITFYDISINTSSDKIATNQIIISNVNGSDEVSITAKTYNLSTT